MARIRYIKPGFFTNEQLGRLKPVARLLFIGLWCVADREGRLEDRPERLKVELLPFDRGSRAEELLAGLAEAGLIQRYEVAGQHYIQVVNFSKHQHPHVKEGASQIPEPPVYESHIRQAQGKHDASSGQALDKNAGERGEGRGSPPNGERATEEGAAASDPVLSLLSKAYENGLGNLSVGVEDELRDWSERIPANGRGEKCIEYAFREAVAQNHRSWSYVAAILTRLESEGWPAEPETVAPPSKAEADWLERRYQRGKA